MNILLVIVILIIAGCSFAGYKAGFIKTIFSMVSVIAALIITSVIAPAVSSGLQSSEKVMNYFAEKTESVLGLEDVKNIEISKQLSFINDLNLPEAIKEALIENNISDVYESLDVDSFVDYITTSVAVYIISAVSFIGVFIVAVIALRILCVVLDIISKLPLLNGLNKITGLAVGFVHGILIVWVFMALITAFGATSIGSSAMTMIGESKFLGTIYDYNIITKYLFKISKF